MTDIHHRPQPNSKAVAATSKRGGDLGTAFERATFLHNSEQPA